MAHQHARIIQHPFATTLQGALLDSYREDQRGKQLDLALNIRSFERTASELFERDRVIHERVQGRYIPVRLQFSGVSTLKNNGFFASMMSLPPDEPARRMIDLLSWRQPKRRDTFYLLVMQSQEAENLRFFARHLSLERLPGESTAVTLDRDWSPAPPMPGRLVPRPQHLYRRFGGDPVTLHIGSRIHRRRLFIGDLEVQGDERPAVDVVFNVGEKPSNWIKGSQTDSRDRWDNKGEGSEGMSVEDLREEAAWVIERLQKNRRVLVHCVAGMNRSSTICCAVLILLEGLTAEQALERVREHHPWARPDSGHWLKLRWLAEMTSSHR